MSANLVLPQPQCALQILASYCPRSFATAPIQVSFPDTLVFDIHHALTTPHIPPCYKMDSRASTSTIPVSQRPKNLTINTSNHTAMVSSKALSQSPTSAYIAFRPSPLNPSSPSSTSSTDQSARHSRRNATFPASRPLRPFPSIAQSLGSTKPIDSGSEMLMRHDSSATSPKPRDEGAVSGGKKSPKTIEISSKWQGGFFLIGMTQAEFSRRD